MRFKKVIAGIMAAALLFSASGCSEARNKKATEAMENAFGSYMSRILAGKNASRFVDAKKEAEYELTTEQDKILKCVLKHAAYEIEESGADAKEGKGRITIEFRYAPAEKIAGKYFDYDLQQVLDALHAPACPGKPRMILLHTLKGKGVSFMEGQVGWHGKAPNDEQAAQALKELEG